MVIFQWHQHSKVMKTIQTKMWWISLEKDSKTKGITIKVTKCCIQASKATR